MTGYSATPLAKKLGIKDGDRVALLGAPSGLAASLAAQVGTRFASALTGTQPFDAVVLFVMTEKDLAARFPKVVARLATAGAFWIAWPKKAAKIETDLSDKVVRALALAGGLVDNKVCAIDDVWSGLRCVRRLQDR